MAAVILSLFLGVLYVGAGTAYADPAQIKDIQKYCKEHVPSKAKDGCTTKNAERALNAMSDKCDKKDQAQFIRCTVNGAEDIIDKVAQQNPKSEDEFNKFLDKAINDAGGPASDFDNPASTSSDPNTNCSNEEGCDLIKKYVNPAIKVLSLSVGLICAASLIAGGIQYSASGGDPQRTGEAKKRISQTLFALFAYAFMLAFLNFLIPGGVFNR